MRRPSSSSIVISSVLEEEIMLVTNPLGPRSWARETIEAVSSGWWVLLVSGIVSIVAGGIIVLIDWSVSDLAVFLGVLLIVRGIFTMFSVPLDGSVRGWAVAVGLLEVAVGVAVLVWPDPTLLVIAAFIGWWVLFGGVMTIAGSITARRILPYWGLFLALGIAETAIGFWLLNRPGLTLVATVVAIGLWSIFYGVVQIAVGVELKNLPSRFDSLEQGFTPTSLSDSRARASQAN
jgi:uncharacterized membrane protein HdeD (DUF308 family)